jgi:hypothetical protein
VLQEYGGTPYTLTLQDATTKGNELLHEFKYWASEAGQEKKRRHKKKAISNIDVPLATMQEVVLVIIDV